PDGWCFSGRKTAAYRQVGNAFPPPVARALGTAIRQALEGCRPAPPLAAHHRQARTICAFWIQVRGPDLVAPPSGAGAPADGRSRRWTKRPAVGPSAGGRRRRAVAPE